MNKVVSEDALRRALERIDEAVVVRKRIKGGIAREQRIDGSRQLRLNLQPSMYEGERFWDCAVLVTDVKYPLEAVGQLYRARACENGFDELKNQWD